MIDKLAKLIDVKSIVTIVCLIVFAVLSLKGIIAGEDFKSVFLIILTYYFTRQQTS